MTKTGRPKALLELSDTERDQLMAWSVQEVPTQRLAQRSQIVLRCADGLANKEVAAELNVSEATVGKWRRRFVADRLDGLLDEPRSGRPPRKSVDQVPEVAAVAAPIEETAPEGSSYWSRHATAARSGLVNSPVGRIWRAIDPTSHRADAVTE